MKATRFLAMLLAIAMMISCTSALAEFPLTQEPVTLKVMARTNSFYPNQDLGSVGNMIEYEKMTGVHIEWENLDPSVWTNTLAASIASEEYPDIIFKGNISNEQAFDWGEDEILVDLAPYLEQYAPNFYALMKQYPDIEKAITAPNGGIYGLPQVVLAPQMRVPTKMYVNNKAVEKIGKELPTTTDELYDFLVALRDSDWNGNGEADEIGLICSTGYLYRYFYGAFGVRTRGAHHDVVDVDPATGELRIFAQSENYRKMLEYLRKLYAEKLIYQEIFTDGNKSVAALAAQERLAVDIDTTLYNIPTDYVADWAGLKYQIAGPDGYAIASEIRSNLHSTGNFAITTACKNVELALQWVDYFYSDEGSLFYHAGVPGVNWEVKEDGKLGYTAETAALRTADTTQDAFIAKFAMWPGGRNPSVMHDNLWGGEYEAEPAATAIALIQYASDTVWPIFSWSEDENEIVNSVQKDISTYITNFTAQVIAGEVELNDSTWNDFVSQIDRMGGKDLVKAYKSACERIFAGEAY